MNTTQPSPTVSPTLAVYVPGYGGAQVPVFGGVDYNLLQPTKSPAPTGSSKPSMVPSLPPAVAVKEKMASYFCGELYTKLIFIFSLAFIYQFSHIDDVLITSSQKTSLARLIILRKRLE